MCLDLPEEVLPKSETNDEEAEYGKKGRLTLYTEQYREYQGTSCGYGLKNFFKLFFFFFFFSNLSDSSALKLLCL